MYAIVQHGGHQYRVSPGDRLLVDRLAAAVGDVITLQPVLFLDGELRGGVGAPAVEGARVSAVVVSHPLGRKLRVFKYKPKKRYRRTHGHRSRLTELRVEAVVDPSQPAAPPAQASAGGGGKKAAAASAASAAPEDAAPATKRRRTRAPAEAHGPDGAAEASSAAPEPES